MSHRLTTLVHALAGVVVGSVVLTGCDFDVFELPLPGGTDVGENPMTITVQFQDVLDLVPQSTVKVNDVNVGKVTRIELDGYSAVATLELRSDTQLPDNAIAEIRQTSLLGEKFVSLGPPPIGASSEPLESGDTIEIEDTGRNPEVEEVLGALSLLLNGGGVAQLKTISHELNQALTGREDAARSVLTQIEDFTANLDDNKVEIVNAIEALNRLSLAVTRQQDDIDSALEELPSALTSIDGQREDLIRMLQALNDLGDVGVRVIKASKDATIDSFRQLQPVLTELANSGDSFVKAFHVFLTYPFVDEVVGRDPQVARNLHMGDYTNLSVTLDLDVSQNTVPTDPGDVLPTDIDPTVIVNNVLECIQSGSLSSEACQDLLATAEGLAQLQAACQKPANKNKAVCKVINQVPGLPGGGLPSELPELSGLGDLGGLGGLLNRAGTGPWGDAASGGPTMGELQAVYDPALVSLLIPGMVVREK
jgi:phospholipid/cholesterol/gamma-HCH transport system substrate-binding protein